jgi:hypothetical protein
MKRFVISMAMALLTSVGISVLMPGCNDDGGDPTGDEFRLTPSSAELWKSGDAVVIQAVGGLEPFRWTTTDTNGSMGTLSGSGRTVSYTRGARNGANVIQVTDSRTWTASATVFQQDAATTGTSDIAVSPATISLNENRDTAVFLASGGSGTYTWTVADARLGHLSGRDGTQVVYTRDRSGNNTVILNDADGNAATATITQPDQTADLAIDPPSASLASEGDRVVFVAAGGTPAYNWTVADGTRGHLDVSTGTSVVYTRDKIGPNTVTVSDRYGNVVTAVITQPAIAPLAVSPTSANVTTNGGAQVFTAIGGTGVYTWEVIQPVSGTLDSPTNATSVVYRSMVGSNRTDVIRLNDGSSTVFATVNKY